MSYHVFHHSSSASLRFMEPRYAQTRNQMHSGKPMSRASVSNSSSWMYARALRSIVYFICGRGFGGGWSTAMQSIPEQRGVIEIANRTMTHSIAAATHKVTDTQKDNERGSRRGIAWPRNK